MAITEEEKQYSGAVKVVGQDELFSADVKQTSDGFKRLYVQTNVNELNADKFYTDLNFTETIYASGAYRSIYSYSGSGLLYGFHIDSDTDKLQVRLTLNGRVIFTDFEVKYLKELKFQLVNSAVFYQNGNFFATDGDDFDFSPKVPIRFNSIDIAVKRSDNNDVKIRKTLVITMKD